MPARGRRRGRRAAPAGVGTAQLVTRSQVPRATRARGARALAHRSGRCRCRRGRVPGSRGHGPPRGASPTADPSSSTRSSRWRTPWSTIAPSSPGGSPLAAVLRGLDRSVVSPGRPRRRGHGGARRVLQGRVRPGPGVRSPSRSSGRRTPLFRPAETEQPESSCPVRRQADPATRARDDPRRRAARA